MLVANSLLCAFVALQRGFELLLSRRNRRRLRDLGVGAGHDPAYPAMVLVHVLLIAGSALEPWLCERPFLPAVGYPALVVFLLAQAGRVWIVRTLGEHWNVRILASAPRGIVIDGPYRWIRHPNYLVVLIEAATLPLVHSAWVTWCVVQALHVPVLARRIRDEERVLNSDPEWTASMGPKPRFLPLRRRRSGA